jgi:hypothetical protein
MLAASMTLAAIEFSLGLIYPDWLEDEPVLGHNVDPRYNLPDPELKFVRKPFVKWEGPAYADPLAHYVLFRTDENGFRNPPGIETAEIAFVGDSFTEAGNVPEQETFVQRVASQLNLTTINLGRGFYGPQQELEVIKRYAFNYSPEVMVWVIFEGNDIEDAEEYLASNNELLQPFQEDTTRNLKSQIGGLIKSTRIFRILKQARYNIAVKYRIRVLRGLFQTYSGNSEILEFNYRYKPSITNELPVGWQETKDSILTGLRLSQERGIRLIIVFIPIKLRVMGPFTTFSSQAKLDEYLPTGKWESDNDFAAQLANYCGDIGCEFVDATERLREKARAGHLVYSARYDTHLDIAGHSVIADLVIEKTGVNREVGP